MPDRRNVEATAGFEEDVVVNYASKCDRPFLFFFWEKETLHYFERQKK